MEWPGWGHLCALTRSSLSLVGPVGELCRLSRAPARLCSLNLVLLFGNELFAQKVGRLHRQAVPAAVVEDAVRGLPLGRVRGAFAVPALVREVNSVFSVVRVGGPDRQQAFLTGNHLGVAPPLHSMLDPLRRDTLLEELVGDAVELVGLAEVGNVKQLLLTAPVPVSLRLHFVREGAAVDYW